MIRFPLATFSVALLTLVGPAVLAASDSKPVFLVHSGPPFTEQAARKLGAEVAKADGPLTAQRLGSARVLSIVGPSAPFTEAERAAIHDFVRGGGSLLIVVDEDARQPRAREIANPLLAPFGLEFTADVPYIHNVGAIAQSNAINRAVREIPYSGGRAVTGGTPFSLICDTDGLAHAAYVEVSGGGRVVAMSDGMAALGLGKPDGVRLSGVPRDPARTTFWGRDSAVFMEEVLAWLLAPR